MDEQALDIVSLVKTLVEPLVDYADELEIYSTETGDGTTLIEISANEEDAGKIIGRQGRVIKSIRTLARAAASRTNAHVEVELID